MWVPPTPMKLNCITPLDSPGRFLSHTPSYLGHVAFCLQYVTKAIIVFSEHMGTFQFMFACFHDNILFTLLLIQGDFKHTFLIRHPLGKRLCQTSFFTPSDVQGRLGELRLRNWSSFHGMGKAIPKSRFQALELVRENIDPNPILMLIDADDIQTHPGKTLRKYCEAVGIPCRKECLQWDASDELLKYFYGCHMEQMVYGARMRASMMQHSCLLASSLLKVPFQKQFQILVWATREFPEGYKVMYETRIKPE